MYGRRKGAWALFAVLLTLSLVGSTLLACAPAPGPSGAPKAAGNLAKEQVLRYPTTEPPSMDPGLATDSVSIQLIQQIFEGLVQFDKDGKPQPMAAEKWDVSPDGKTYTFTLRKGLKWSNGDPLTAKDFEFAWKRNLDPATASDYANTLYPIKGAEAYNTKKSNDPNSVGVTAKDDQTLVVNLEEPAGYFLRLIATWTAFPLPKKVMDQFKDKWTEGNNIASNGPFKVQSWKHDQEMVLVRNDNYWGTKPTLEKIQIKIFAESDQEQSQEMAAYENGEVDLVRSLPPTDVDRVKNDAKLGKEYTVSIYAGTYFAVFNASKKPFDDARVRRALALAVDNQKIIDILKTVAKPADSVIPPGTEGRNPSAYEKRPDVAKAKQLLSEAGYPNGQGFPEFTYAYNTASSHKAVAEYLQDVWSKELGLKVKLQNMEWNVFLKWRGSEPNNDVYRGGWIMDYEDPNNFHNVLLDSEQSGSTFNPRWKNAEYDKLVRQARGETDAAKRKALYEQADGIVAKELPFLPFYYYGTQRVIKPYVDGLWIDNMDHMWFKTARILQH